jgi:hypothetical protein
MVVRVAGAIRPHHFVQVSKRLSIPTLRLRLGRWGGGFVTGEVKINQRHLFVALKSGVNALHFSKQSIHGSA